MILTIIEYVDEKTKWYLTIGNKKPWDNFHIRVTKWLANKLI